MKAKREPMIRMRLRCERELETWLRRVAALQGKSISAVVRDMLAPAFNARRMRRDTATA